MISTHISCDHNTYHIRFRDTWLQREKEATRPFTFQPKALEMFENQYKSELLIRSHPRGRGFESLQVHQTRFGRTPISSAAVSPCSVRPDPQQKSAVLGVIPRRRFFAIRTFDFRYFSCYNGCKNKQEVIQIHFFPYTVRPCATGADFLAGVKFPYISIKEELQKLRLIPHKFPLFFGILPKKRNKKSTNRYIGNAGKLILICYN